MTGRNVITFKCVFHPATPGWPGEIFDFGNEQNDEDSTSGGCFCIRVVDMDKLKGTAAAGGSVRLPR